MHDTSTADEFDSIEELDEFDQNTAWTHRNESVLRFLYDEKGYSQTDIAERFGVTQTTISHWFDKHEITTGWGYGSFDLFEQDNGVEYGRLRVQDGETLVPVYEHQLLALSDGVDPTDVFGNDDTELHHRLPAKIALNVPENVQLLSVAEHRNIDHPRAVDGKHHDADTPSSIEEIGFEQSDVPLTAVDGLHGSRLSLDDSDSDESDG